MTWTWRFADEAGVAVNGPVIAFESQDAAEAWLGEEYSGLLDDGITAVSLFDGEQAVYGPMPLTPA